MGWIGSAGQLRTTLDLCGCDRLANGDYCTAGRIFSFLGMHEEYVVDDDAVFFVNGEPKPLAETLTLSGHHGVKVTVIS